MPELIVLIVLLVLVVVLLNNALFVVKQQTDVIIERFGRYARTARPGLQAKVPFVDRKAAVLDLRVQQIDIALETKTKDNVFVTVQVSTQYRIDPNQVERAFYELARPEEQIKRYMEDAIRSAIPSMDLDAAFERKDDVAQNVQETVGDGMGKFGFVVIKTLVTSIDPAADVKEAMNSINAAQRQRIAAQELANADKIRIVTRAQADAEQSRLQGVGLANQRQAIVDGLARSFAELNKYNISEDTIMSVLMLNQYMDVLSGFSHSGTASTVMIPGSPGGLGQLRDEILQAIVGGRAAQVRPARNGEPADVPSSGPRRPPAAPLRTSPDGSPQRPA